MDFQPFGAAWDALGRAISWLLQSSPGPRAAGTTTRAPRRSVPPIPNHAETRTIKRVPNKPLLESIPLRLCLICSVPSPVQGPGFPTHIPQISSRPQPHPRPKTRGTFKGIWGQIKNPDFVRNNAQYYFSGILGVL
jgi:hypothetical protein